MHTGIRIQKDYCCFRSVTSISIIEDTVFREDVVVSYYKILETTTNKSFLGEFSNMFIELSTVGDNMGFDPSVCEWLGLLTRYDFDQLPRYKDRFGQRAAEVVKGIRDRAWDDR
jgi:hypothetical protein